ncbi:MAG: M6 family metalloprotease domain-containing protein [Saprospiraceae bacterium]
MKQYLLCLFAVLLTLVVSAEPFDGAIRSFSQPDGSVVDVKLFGNEYYMRAEGLDGYTVIRDKESGWISYARLSGDGNLLISSQIYYKGRQDQPQSLRNDLAVAKHLDISETQRELIVARNIKQVGESPDRNILQGFAAHEHERGTPVVEVNGNIKGLSIIVDFPDKPAPLQLEAYDSLLNGVNFTDYGCNGSLRAYFYDMSRGQLDYINVVTGVFRAPENYSYYDSLPYATGAQQLLRIALDSLKNQGFDFSSLTLNSDNTIRAINIMFTGDAKNWAEGMWHHKGSISGFSVNGIKAWDYNTSPANEPLKTSTIVHENGHMIGKWPDTYKYSADNGIAGLSSFDVMCSMGSSKNPVPPNPLFRANAGWVTVVDVTDFEGINHDTVNSFTIYKYRNKNNPNEFFLLENRLRLGRSSAIPDEGLTIWHIDRLGNNQTMHHEVYLVNALDDQLKPEFACFRTPKNVEFADATVPNSKFYDESASGLRVWEIGTRDTIMQYRLGEATTLSALKIIPAQATDNNGNGSFEAGETCSIKAKMLNLGQAESMEAIVSCRVLDESLPFAQLLSSELNVGILLAGDTVPASFDFVIDPATPFGTWINFEFALTDGQDTFTMLSSIQVGLSIKMVNSEAVTACEANFYDDGGLDGEYSLNTNFPKTFFPVNPADKVRVTFSSFDLEEEPTCSWDYMRVYDGPDTFSPLIGKYCGSTLPPDIVSTHATGALTFQFRSDELIVKAGWAAFISCDISSATSGTELAQVQVFPNPGKGKFYIQATKPLSYEISNASGIIIQGMKAAQEGLSTLDMQAFPAGIYTLRMQAGSEVLVRKLVLQ